MLQGRAKMKAKIMIKPLSVNMAYASTYYIVKKGKEGEKVKVKVRRVKSKEYKKYLSDMKLLLPNIELPPEPYTIHYEFGFSSKACDLDNAVKPLQDVLQWNYGFNDNLVYFSSQQKVIVPKGKEYIYFSIKHYGEKL